jgi:hypothetical protein
MYKVQDYSVLYNNTVRPVICNGLHFTHMLKITCISLRDEVWAHKTTLTTPLFIDGTGCLNMKEFVISVETWKRNWR